MGGLDSGDDRRGSWLGNVLLAAGVGLAVALIVVVAFVMVDRLSSPGIQITTSEPPPVKVGVAGAVATPGVYALPADARLVDIIGAAGGLTDQADRSQLNLAARVGDGERIVIPEVVAESQDPIPGTPETVIGLINVNRASAAQLELLPGIGPVLAGRILDERETNGPYLTVDDLSRVDGISEATVEELRPFVTVDG